MKKIILGGVLLILVLAVVIASQTVLAQDESCQSEIGVGQPNTSILVGPPLYDFPGWIYCKVVIIDGDNQTVITSDVSNDEYEVNGIGQNIVKVELFTGEVDEIQAYLEESKSILYFPVVFQKGER